MPLRPAPGKKPSKAASSNNLLLGEESAFGQALSLSQNPFGRIGKAAILFMQNQSRTQAKDAFAAVDGLDQHQFRFPSLFGPEGVELE